MSKSTVIIDVYNECKTASRDIEVAKKINAFFKNNIQAVSDGIINTTLKISGTTRDDIASCYHLTPAHWKRIQNSPEYSKFSFFNPFEIFSKIFSICNFNSSLNNSLGE